MEYSSNANQIESNYTYKNGVTAQLAPDAEERSGFSDWMDIVQNSEYGSTSMSGARVSEHSAMMMPAFWQGVEMKSGDVAKIPLEIYRRGEGTDRQLDPKHRLYQMVRHQVNPEMSAFDWRRQMMCHRLVWNNCYSFIDRDQNGIPVGLYPLLPDRTDCEKVGGQKVYISEIDGKLRYFDAYDIWHVKGITFDGMMGLRLVHYARNEIGKILARTQFASKFFKNGGRIGGILQLPFSKNKVKLDRMESGFRKTYEDVDSAFKTVILRENAQFLAAQANFRDTQLVEVGQEDIRTVARLLNIPPHRLGAQGASSYSSLEQENRTYYDSSLSHHFAEFESECWLKLFDKQTKQTNSHFFEHTIGALLWADSSSVAEIGSKLVMGGIARRNEVRRWFNLNADPDGDRLLIPSGMTYADSTKTNEALEEVERSVAQRFNKRLAVHCRKAIKNNEIEKFLSEGIRSHLPIGSEMFQPLVSLRRSMQLVEKDHAEELIQRFIELVKRDPEKTITEFENKCQSD